MRLCTFLCLLMLTVGYAHAEVMDKEPPLSFLCFWGAIAIIVSGVAACFRPWALLVLVPLTGYMYFAFTDGVTDPYVGPAILREAGSSYLISTFAFPVLYVAVIALCCYWRVREKKRSTDATPQHP